MNAVFVGTQEIRFGRKTNEIAKFSILDEKRNSQFWTKNGQQIARKSQILSHSLAIP